LPSREKTADWENNWRDIVYNRYIWLQKMISILWTLSHTNLFEESFPIKNLTFVKRARHLKSPSLYNCHTSRRGKLDIVSLFRFNIKHIIHTQVSPRSKPRMSETISNVMVWTRGVVAVAYSQLLRLLHNNLSNRYEFIILFMLQ